jgi:hypothetical protein
VRGHAEAIGTTVTLRAAAPCVERLLALTDTRALFTAAIPEPVVEPVTEHSRHPDEAHFTGPATGVDGRADRLVPPARAGGPLFVRCLGQQDPAAPAA